MKEPTQQEVDQFIQDLRDIDCPPEELRATNAAPTFEQAKAQLADLQQRAKKAFRRLALELHPDRTGNDPAKAERFRRLVEVHEWVSSLEVHPPRPRPVTFYFTSVSFSCGATASTSGWGPWPVTDV